VFLVVLAGSAPAGAQYFGQNKVQYRTFDFQILSTAHFDIYFYPAERTGAELAARLAERWRDRLGRVLHHELTGRQTLILYASATDFQQTNVIPGDIGEGTGGVTEGVRRRIVLPFAATLADTDHVIGHELVHAFQYDIGTGIARQAGGRQQGMSGGVERLPLWFIEGMAEYYSIGTRSPLTAMWLRDAVAREKLPSIRDLENPEYFPYRWGHALWAYIAGRWGDDAVWRLLRMGIELSDPDKAFQAVLGVNEKQLSSDWQASLRSTYDPLLRDRIPPQRVARALTGGKGLGEDLNVSPALSHDGRRIAYLSSRSLFSIDLYVADAQTGQQIRQLTSTATDPHYNSLEFIESAGSWDPTNQRLAIAAVADGRPVIAVYDVDTGRRERDIALPGIDGASTPAWSPDGRTIALVGMAQGLSDLYLLDVQSGTLTRLTSDPYSDLQPAWSPDGTRLAFSTDRFTSSLEDMHAGPLRIAVMTVASRDLVQAPGFERGNHITPQWDADGTLYFVANPDGIPNIYRVAADGGTPAQVTDVPTGISGITESSPALTVGGGRAAFSVFSGGDYRLYVVDHPEQLATPANDVIAARDAAQLPPLQRTGAQLTDILANNTQGLPPATAEPVVKPYRPRLHLDYVGQPTFGVGVDRFGAFGGGGISFLMSDTLGNHMLGVAVQTATSFDDSFRWSDLGGGAMYTNATHRWNWGVEADQTPYRTGFVSGGEAIVNGTLVGVNQAIIQRETNRGVTGTIAYPLSRAQRVEASAGFRNLTFEQELRTQVFDLVTGELLQDERQTLSSFKPLNLGQMSAALVYDTSSFGATSPVAGQRYRFEVTPTIGSIRFAGVLADYRRYFTPARLYTVAVRLMHYGRYGAGSEDFRLAPLFLGYPNLVRGYDVGTFDARDCPPTAVQSCPAFDRLIGSRILVANAELRFPLLRPFGLSRNVYGPVPAEVAFFADGGAAWTRDERPTFFGGHRKGVSSVGAALRLNMFGFAVVQLDAARPLQRDGRGWVFQFSLSPGF
jgi:hypothetical protein